MKKILVIDDQKDNLSSVKAVISTYMSDCEVITALSGKEGIKLAKKEQPDTILLDIIMPEMDGYEVCIKLKSDETTKHIPIIMITAIKTDSDSFAKGLDIGADAFLSKPINHTQLIAQIKVMLRIKEHEDSLISERKKLENIVIDRTKELIETNRELKNEILERKITDEKQNYTQRRNQAWIENSPVCTKIVDLDFNLQYMSSSGVRELKIDDISEYYGTPYPLHFYPDSFKIPMVSNLKKAKETGKTLTQEAPIVDTKGNKLWYHSTIVPVYDDKNKLDYILVVSLETTKQKQAEEKLKISSLATETSFNAIFATDIKGSITYANNTAANMWGYKSSTEMIGTDAISYWTKSTQSRAREMIELLLKDGLVTTSGELIGKRLDGTEFVVESNSILVKDENGKPTELIGSFSDITDRKQTEQKLLVKDQVFESSLSAISTSDIDGVITLANAAFLELWGYDNLDDVKGHPIPYFFVDPDEALPILESLNKTDIWKGEFLAKRKDGSTFIAQSLSSVIRNENGELTGYHSSVIDITERKKTEESLVSANKLLELTGTIARIGGWELDMVSNEMIFTKEALLINDLDPSTNLSLVQAFEMIHPDDRAAHQSVVEQSLIDGKSWDRELRMTTAKGRNIWIRTQGKVDMKNGKAIKLYGSFQDITSHKQAEESLRESEKRYRLLSENSTDTIWLMRLDGTFLYHSPAVMQLRGYTPEEANKVSMEKTMTPESMTFLGKLFAREEAKPMKERWNSLRFELEMFRKDGTKIWTEVAAKGVFDDNGQIVGLQGATHDITKRKLAEVEILRSNSLLNSIIESPDNVIMFAIDSSYNYIGFNTAHKKEMKYAYDADIEIGQPILSYVPGKEDRLKSIKNYERVLKGERFIEIQQYGIEESRSWYELIFNPMIDSLNNVTGFTVFVTNITDRKLAEKAIKESEEKYRTLTDNMILGQVLHAADTSIIFSNPAASEILGLSDGQMYGKKAIDPQWKFVKEDKSDMPLEEYPVNIVISTKEKLANYTLGIKHPDRDYITWVMVNAVPIINKEKKLEYVSITFSDITDAKKAENELLVAKARAEESDRLKTAFLANMSHEIRTPMNGILGFAELLKEPNLSGEKQQRYISIIEKGGARMLNIINDIVSISKIESGQVEVHIKESNVNDQIEYIYTFFKPEIEGKDMQFSFKNSLSSKKSIIKTDREKVYSILSNLIKNAIKYSKQGSIEFGYIKKDSFLEFYVKDTGIGVPKERQEAIFKRFIQADIADKNAYQGAGLGLSISKAYVEMLGGKIWVESEEGSGSCFYFTLPYETETIKETITKKEVSPSHKVEPINNLKILIAEDEETSEEFITVTVQNLVKEIINVQNGTEAVDACRKNPDIDLILMDIRMPKMDGYEATRKIRNFNKDVIIIAQTAYALSGDKEKAIAAGCNDYITKPIKKDELIEKIESNFSKKKYFNDK